MSILTFKMIGKLIGGFVTMVLGVALFPVIKQQITIASINITSSSSSNLSGAVLNNATQIFGTGTMSATVFNIIPYFFVGAVILCGIAVAFSSLRDVGIIDGENGDEENSDDENEEEQEEQEEETEEDKKEGTNGYEHKQSGKKDGFDWK